MNEKEYDWYCQHIDMMNKNIELSKIWRAENEKNLAEREAKILDESIRKRNEELKEFLSLRQADTENKKQGIDKIKNKQQPMNEAIDDKPIEKSMDKEISGKSKNTYLAIIHALSKKRDVDFDIHSISAVAHLESIARVSNNTARKIIKELKDFEFSNEK